MISASVALIAHASTRAMRTGAFPDDDPLDARGRLEIAEFVERWNRPRLASVFASPMLCAVQTAEAMGFNAIVDHALADIDYGRWRGMQLDELAQRDPVALRAWLDDPTVTPHGGESFTQLRARIENWLDCVSVHRTVVAITHVAVIRAALVHALGLDTKAAFALSIAPMAHITLNRVSDRCWEVAQPR